MIKHSKTLTIRHMPAWKGGSSLLHLHLRPQTHWTTELEQLVWLCRSLPDTFTAAQIKVDEFDGPPPTQSRLFFPPQASHREVLRWPRPWWWPQAWLARHSLTWNTAFFSSGSWGRLALLVELVVRLLSREPSFRGDLGANDTQVSPERN